MATRRVREVVWEAPSPHYLAEKAAKGWTLVALEWERDMDDEEARALGLVCDVPYGLRIAANGLSLEEEPAEREVLTEMLGLMVRDEVGFTTAAQLLNAKGFRARDGKPWTATAIFEMMPRLVEVAPEILTSDEWEALRQRL